MIMVPIVCFPKEIQWQSFFLKKYKGALLAGEQNATKTIGLILFFKIAETMQKKEQLRTLIIDDPGCCPKAMARDFMVPNISFLNEMQ